VDAAHAFEMGHWDGATRAAGLSRDGACKLSKSVTNFHRICSAMPGAVLCENGARGRGHVETPPLGFEGYAR
jgi:uncharacterized protein (DUF2237 family)